MTKTTMTHFSDRTNITRSCMREIIQYATPVGTAPNGEKIYTEQDLFRAVRMSLQNGKWMLSREAASLVGGANRLILLARYGKIRTSKEHGLGKNVNAVYLTKDVHREAERFASTEGGKEWHRNRAQKKKLAEKLLSAPRKPKCDDAPLPEEDMTTLSGILARKVALCQRYGTIA